MNEEIRRRHNAVKLEIKRIEPHGEGWTNCPVCHNCPFCEGDTEVETKMWTYDSLAAGLQVFGIGDDLHALEEFAKHAYDDIKILLAEVDGLKEINAKQALLRSKVELTRRALIDHTEKLERKHKKLDAEVALWRQACQYAGIYEPKEFINQIQEEQNNA